MKNITLFSRIVFLIACLLVAVAGYWLYQTQARLQKATQQTQTAKAQARLAEERKQQAQKRWDDYNRAELRAIVAKIRPTLQIVTSQGQIVKLTNPIPPVAGLQVVAYVDSVVQKHLPDEFRYQITKGRALIHRGSVLIAEQACEDNKINLASLNTRPGDMVAFEVLEMYQTDKTGKKELVKPKNPIIRFGLR